MALAREFKASVFAPNQVGLNWRQPLDFNNQIDEQIVTKTITHYPMELFNPDFPNRATDSRPVEIFRGRTIVGLTVGTISVVGNTLTDSSASFPTTPSLRGRFLRDSQSKVHRIISNTPTSVSLETTPANGKYVILADFVEEATFQENYELDVRTQAGPGFIKNLVIIDTGVLQLKIFEPDELANLIFQDGAITR